MDTPQGVESRPGSSEASCNLVLDTGKLRPTEAPPCDAQLIHDDGDRAAVGRRNQLGRTKYRIRYRSKIQQYREAKFHPKAAPGPANFASMA